MTVDRLRVGFVSRRFFPAVSGMSVYAINLLRQLVAGGHDVVMVSQYRGDERGRAVYGGGPPPPVPGVEVVAQESLGEQDGGDFERDVAAIVAALVAAHARTPFDVLHAQYGYPPGLAVLEASRQLGVPSVVSIQGGDGHWVGSCCGTHRRAMHRVLTSAGAVLVGSRSFAGEVSANHDVPVDRFAIVPGATDTARFTPHHTPPGPDEDRRNGGPLRLLYHGRVDARKGVLDLIDAVGGLTDGGRDVTLVLSGVGPDVAPAAQRVTELGLDARVRTLGAVDYADAPDVYRQGDVFVSPTYAEGFSNTILEAMASGLPIVSTRSVGVVDCLRDGENGLLVQPGDVPGLAGAVERLIDDEPLRRRLAATALDEVRRCYAWPVVADRIVDVYRSLLGTAPDVGWDLDRTIEPCRFRAAPHLL